jgi:hypothetical protein
MSELSHPKEIFPFHLIKPFLTFKPSRPMIDHDWSLIKMSSFFATKTWVQWNSTSLWPNDFLIVQKGGKKKKRETLVIVVQATPWSELKSLFHLCFLSLLYGMRGRYPHPWASYTVCAPILREVISWTTVDAWKGKGGGTRPGCYGDVKSMHGRPSVFLPLSSFLVLQDTLWWCSTRVKQIGMTRSARKCNHVFWV